MRSSFCGRRRDGCHKIPALWEVFRIPQYTMIQNTTKYTAPVRSIQVLHLQPRHTLVSCSNTECEHRFMVFLFQPTPTNTRDSVKCYCAAPKCGVACWMLMNTLAVDRGSFSPPLYLFDFVFCLFVFSSAGRPSLTSQPANTQLVTFLSDGNWWVVLYLYLLLYFSHLFSLVIFAQKYALSFPFGEWSLSSDGNWWSVLVVDQADVNVKRHFHPLANLFRGFFSLSHWSLRGRWWRWVRQWSELRWGIVP